MPADSFFCAPAAWQEPSAHVHSLMIIPRTSSGIRAQLALTNAHAIKAWLSFFITPVFSGTDAEKNAIQWVHDNIHPLAVKFDVEITVNLAKAQGSHSQLWRIGGVGTNHLSNAVNPSSALLKTSYGDGKAWSWGANWHSHARGYGHDMNFSGPDRNIIKSYSSHNIKWYVSSQNKKGGSGWKSF